MVSNQPPPFPAFGGLGTEVTEEEENDQAIVESGAGEQETPDALDDAFAELRPDDPEE